MGIRLLVVEDEIDIREQYRKALTFHPQIELVGEAKTKEEANVVLLDQTVDALILSLKLSSGDEMQLIEQLKSLPYKNPFVVVVSHIESKAVFDALRGMGVDYVCRINETNFSYDTPLSVMEIAMPFLSKKEAEAHLKTNENIDMLHRFYEKKIRCYFKCLNFPSQVKGTMFCKEAVLYLIMHPNREVCITKEIYPDIAQKYGTTAQNVERQIRVVIENVWLKQPLHIIKTFYRSYYNENIGRPTNGDFVRNVAKRILLQ